MRAFLADLIRERDAAEAAEKDRRIVERLAAILNDFGVHGDDRKADAEYASAFRAYGVDLDALDPAAAGRVLAASPAAADLASALDQWAFLRRGRALRDPVGAERLVAMARAADPDPWRNRLRDTLGRMEGGPARRLEALERLAATADVDHLPVASVTRLAASLAFLGRRGTAIALLRRAQSSHRDDFWVNADLARELMATGRAEEAVRFFAVAAGVRPRSGLALSGLGKALLLSGQPAEAADTFREVTRLRPDDALGPRRPRDGTPRARGAAGGRRRIRRGEAAEARRLDGPRPDRPGATRTGATGPPRSRSRGSRPADSRSWRSSTRRSPTPCSRPAASTRPSPNSARPSASTRDSRRRTSSWDGPSSRRATPRRPSMPWPASTSGPRRRTRS